MRLLPFEYAVRNLGRSPVRLSLMLVGGALVVLLVVAATGFVRGMSASLRASGSPENVIVLAAGSEESVERSEVDASWAGLLASSVPGIRRTAGLEHVSPEVHIMAHLRHAPDDPRSHAVNLRGVTEAAMLVHRRVRVTHGRWPAPGEDGVLVGRHALRRLSLPDAPDAIGRELYFDGKRWAITGVIASPGSVIDSEVWVPLPVLQIATRRDSLSCVVLTLDGAELADVQVFTSQRVDLQAVALSEAGYYAQVAAFYSPIRFMALATAGLIALGGLFGGLNTLYAAFAARVREFAALQTLGFPRRAILLSLVQESLLVAMAGGLVAVALAVLLLDGLAVSFAAGAVGLRIDSAVVAAGLASAALLGLAGALPPSFHCLRLPITTALKSA